MNKIITHTFICANCTYIYTLLCNISPPCRESKQVIDSVGMVDEATRTGQQWQRYLSKRLQHPKKTLLIRYITTKLIHHNRAKVEETRVMVTAVNLNSLEIDT